MQCNVTGVVTVTSVFLARSSDVHSVIQGEDWIDLGHIRPWVPWIQRSTAWIPPWFQPLREASYPRKTAGNGLKTAVFRLFWPKVSEIESN